MKSNKYRFLIQGIKKFDNQLKEGNTELLKKGYKVNLQFNQNLITLSVSHFEQLSTLYNYIKMSAIAQDFSQYMSLPSQILGKRASKIIISKSRKFCMKLIEEQDLRKIEQMFPDLFLRFKQNKGNCLVKIYFIFIVEYNISGVKFTDRYILMPNIRSQFDLCVKAFDIKGFLQSRLIDEEDSKDFKFGKDENFVVSKQLRMLKKQLSYQQRKKMIEQIRQNLEFLLNRNIIDYSLLISFQIFDSKQITKTPQIFDDNLCHFPCQSLLIKQQKIVLKWAIIDYFQQYNQKKKMQNKFKSLFKKAISSVEPQMYSKRFIEFLGEYILN